MKFNVIDLFCGAGGVTEGIQKAVFNKRKVAKVIACINHDSIAIESHLSNHKRTKHFTEDIKTFDLSKLPELDRSNIIVLWASLECTNFSKAKGGKPRNADSRTLAEHLFRYIEYINPDYIMIENVREFMAWGKLDDNGKPLSMDKGKDYLKWVKNIKNYGYDYDYRLLDAADFGANCLRKRYFGMFAKKGLPMKFPQPTHSKKVNPMFKTKQWKPVRECLDLTDEGNSIFGRKKELSKNTLKRIFEGLKKFATRDKFLFTYVSSTQTKDGIRFNAGKDLDDVASAITTQDKIGLIFLHTFHGKNGKTYSLDNPSVSIPTKDEIALIQPVRFIDCQYSTGRKNQSVNDPSGSILTNPKERLLTCHFIDEQYTDPRNVKSIDKPAGAIVKNPKANLVSAQFIMNRQFNNNCKSVDEISNTIIAQQGKRPMYLISPVLGETEEGLVIVIYKNDSEEMKTIKIFMAENGIIDIKMRMLKVDELKMIMGLSKNYILKGTQTKQKWMIGNMVHPVMSKNWFEALASEFEKLNINKAA